LSAVCALLADGINHDLKSRYQYWYWPMVLLSVLLISSHKNQKYRPRYRLILWS